MWKTRKIIYRVLKNFKFLPNSLFLKIRYGAYTGKKLNLKNPIEFNEKVNWYKRYYHPPILTKLADKYAVREYVKEKIGIEYLNELYGFYTSFEDIDLDSLPEQFVIKAVHGSSTNLIVRNKSQLDIAKVKQQITKWLTYDHYKRRGFEWAYKNIKPAVIIEKYLQEDNKFCLTDYKFSCFDGKAKFVQLIMAHNGLQIQAYYDKNFELQKYNRKNREAITGHIEKPILFDKMWEMAEILADKLPYVRVDFYQVDQKIIFGELTFYPGDGKYDFYPDEYNKIIGDYFKLPALEKGQKEIVVY